jgi:lysyl oxidase-like protein 2/3/4
MNKGVKIHYKTKQPIPAFLSMANGYGTAPLCLAFSDHNGTGSNAGAGTYIIGFGYNRYLYDREHDKDIVAALKNMNPEVEVEGHVTHDWVNDPFSKGAWSAWGPGYMTKYLSELQKPHGRVHFASADWADGWRGFIDGAIERGSASARDVHHLLKQDYPMKL